MGLCKADRLSSHSHHGLEAPFEVAFSQALGQKFRPAQSTP